MKIVFMGTPAFAEKSLNALIAAGHELLAVFTQPDKKSGRGQKFVNSPVKECALANNIKIFQPISLKNDEIVCTLKNLAPDLIVVVAYGKILPENILNIPKYGCVNVHASLLPQYRGAAPIQWAIIDGQKKTGITTMFMDKGMDTGDMLLKKEVEIGENVTSGELFDQLSAIGAELLVQTVEKIKDNSLVSEKQKDEYATYAPMISKEMAKVNWNEPAKKIHNLVRGLNPWPVAFMHLDEKKVKVYKTRLCDCAKGQPGEIKSTNPFVVVCGNNTAVEIVELQPENKRKMLASEFFRGYKIKSHFLN